MANGEPVVLVATRNSGKSLELRDLFAAAGYRVVDLEQAGVLALPAEDDVEHFATFDENAVAKAQYYHRTSGGLPTVADDSGLVVPALGGAPGVMSKRWAGITGSEADVSAANNRKLLDALKIASSRKARFVSAVAWVDERRTMLAQGDVVGRIALAPRGNNGFGYDPLFEVDELGGRTFAEASTAEKSAISHRGRAFARLARALREATTGGLVDARRDASYTERSRGA